MAGNNVLTTYTVKYSCDNCGGTTVKAIAGSPRGCTACGMLFSGEAR